MDLLADLDARGLVHDTTDREALAARLAEGPITVYHGMDPSADSLHTGNLIGLIALRRFQLAGHRPIALAGGATGMVGDPSGRSGERNLLDEETLRANVEAIKAQIARVLGPIGDWELVDNYDWTSKLTLLDFLRDVGKHATVNQMIARESVKARMASEHGISYTEFSYMLLQAHDYWWLHQHRGCELQIGGSDQWGNILSGVDLIRRRDGVAVHALSWPLLEAPDGTKLGKTTGARIWLDPARTSPYQLFQHFLNTDDRQVRQMLLWFTLLPVEEIDALVAAHEVAPERREAQRVLAREVTGLVHGADEAARAESGSRDWDENRDPSVLAAREGTIDTTYLGSQPASLEVVPLLVQTGLAASRSAATRLIKQGGVSVGDERVTDPALVIDPAAFVDGRWLMLGVGKRQRHLLVLDEGVDVRGEHQ
ncbi:MAG: tyrosyl-tRNA synthetase [Acidimicrobiaceae bacterium]|jgi:tyrosyl-tRNA synthetase